MPDSVAINPPLTPKKEEILTVSARLFAQKGYAAVSMRELASETNMTPAALYHHYADKEALYYAVLLHVFTDKASAITELTRGKEPSEEKLKNLILWLIKLFSRDEIFALLLHRELLDGNSARIKLLTREVIETPFLEVERLIGKLVPNRNPKSLAVSAMSLILGHFQLMPILRNLTMDGALGQASDQELALADTVKSLVLGLPDPVAF